MTSFDPRGPQRVAISRTLPLQNVRGVVVDEADACLSVDAALPETVDAMVSLQRYMANARASVGIRETPQVILTGASLSPSMVQSAIDMQWVRSPTLVSERGCIEHGMQYGTIAQAGEGSLPRELLGQGVDKRGESDAIAGVWTEQRVPAGHTHEFVVVKPNEAVATICRLLREQFEAGDLRARTAGLPPYRVG